MNISTHSEPHTNLAILRNLNAEQHAVVTLPNQHALVLAGAGSGKTRVLTTRIAWLLLNRQAAPNNILAVTFTNKAAKEMQLRLSSMLPFARSGGMWIGTFHGLCHRLLKTHWQAAKVPQSFLILDVQDQLSSIKRMMKQFQIDEQIYPAKKIQNFIANCKENGLRAHHLELQNRGTQKLIECYQLYENQCQREGVLDFGELILRSFELLRDNAELRLHYQSRFKYILIDEFQDTNRLQYDWMKQFCGENSTVLAVGDDDQSIYSFRGARVKNMVDFLNEFSAKQIKLELNYRSFGHILDAANGLIEHNQMRLGKNLKTNQDLGEPVRIFEAPSDWLEAQWLTDEIRELLKAPPNSNSNSNAKNAHVDSSHIARKDIAVLYRSNAQSRVLETALVNAKIAYRVYGGLRFFDRAEVKHALAYLRLIDNPRDDTSFLRVVNFPPRGIGARSLEALQDAASQAGSSLVDAISLLEGKIAAKINTFVAQMDVLREVCAGKTLREIVLLMLENSGLSEHYKTERDGQDRLENLNELVNAAESFVIQEGFTRDDLENLNNSNNQNNQNNLSDLDHQNNQDNFDLNNLDNADYLNDLDAFDQDLSPLSAFLTHASLEAGDNQAQAGQDAIQLMTIHASKGLEFDAVFITGLEEGLFPHSNNMNDKESLEEERRLMYVAITRARKRLYISYAQSRLLNGQERYNFQSRFLEELPESAIKWLSVSKNKSTKTPFQNRAFASSFSQSAKKEPEKQSHSSPAQFKNLHVGMNVFHSKFGEGCVLTIEGKGDLARAQIRFVRHGIKELSLSVALEKITPI